MSYQNPIPSVNDESVSKHFWLGFDFDKYLTREDAAANIIEYLQNHTMKKEHIHMGHPRFMRMFEPQPPKEYYVLLIIDTETKAATTDSQLYYTVTDARKKN